jgi:hypothetical protein
MSEILDDITDDRFAIAEQNLEKAAKKLPNISVDKPKALHKERKTSSVSLPSYVWSQLRLQAGMREEPYNTLILKGLKEIGFDIDDDDLIDPRKLRHLKNNVVS